MEDKETTLVSHLEALRRALLRSFMVLALGIVPLFLAALLTPPDIVSQLMLGAPTYLLFEAGLLAAHLYKK